MERIETTNPKEARRSRIAQFSGRAATLTLGASTVTGLVRSVMKDESCIPAKWIITVIPQEPKPAVRSKIRVG